MLDEEEVPVNLNQEQNASSILESTAIVDAFCNLNGHDMQQQQQMALDVAQHHQLSHALVSVESCVCRICHTNNSKEPLVSPCRCKGSLAYVHLSCLERWLNESCRSYCELCRFNFNAIKTPRYRLPESLRIWISHPRNRRNMQSDLLILTLLTIITIGLIAVLLVGMQYFIIEGRKVGISKHWTRGAIWFFLALVILGYITAVYLLAKDQLSPWYRWWKSTVNVRLVVDPQLLRSAPDDEPFHQDNEHQPNVET